MPSQRYRRTRPSPSQQIAGASLALSRVMIIDPQALRARDFMQRDFISVRPHTPILTAHRLFVDKKIHGAPVVDDRDEVIGVISTIDLLRVIRRELEPGRMPTYATYFWDDATESLDHVDIPESDALWRLRVQDAMTKDVAAVAPDAPLTEVARLMIDRRIHRVLVMTGGKLEGVVTTFDLMFALASAIPQQAAVAEKHSGYSR